MNARARILLVTVIGALLIALVVPMTSLASFAPVAAPESAPGYGKKKNGQIAAPSAPSRYGQGTRT